MNGNNDVVNVHNDVVTMDDNAVATMLESMRKGSKWLTAFLESLPDGQGGGGAVACQPPHLAGVSQQQDAALYPSGR